MQKNRNSMIQPLISVIVPCYNVEEYLPKCIESVLAQTYINWELILVDDGSKDRTPQLCDAYAAKDERINVIHKSNGGLVSARNAGFDVMKGEWHTYIDGDDWVDTDMLEKLVAYVGRHEGVEIVFWKLVQELGDKSIKGKMEWKCEEQEHLYTGSECHELARHTLVYKSGIATAYSKFILTDYAKKNGVRHDDRLRQGAEGIEFSLRAFYHAKKALYVNEYLNHYRYNPNSISKKVDEKNTQYLLECFHVIEKDINGFADKEMFIGPFYQRVVYAIIATAMSTYFHPMNRIGVGRKISVFAKVIRENQIFATSISKCKTTGMDIQRKLVLCFIRYRMYFMLPLIGWMKQYYFKKGKYNY